MTEHQDETHKVLAQADALMRRHRVFIAGAAAENAEDPVPQEDDIPTLTEVVGEAGPTSPETPEPLPIQELLAVQQQQIEDTVEQWLDEKLPEEVLRVMDGFTDQLIAALVTRMRTELIPQLRPAQPFADTNANIAASDSHRPD